MRKTFEVRRLGKSKMAVIVIRDLIRGRERKGIDYNPRIIQVENSISFRKCNRFARSWQERCHRGKSIKGKHQLQGSNIR